MKSGWPILALILVAALLLAACNLSQSPTADNNAWLKSAVPGTLTAIALQPTVTRTPTETVSPTSTPEPTPTLEPSRLQVVYSKDGSIWLWREGNEPKQLSLGTKDERPRISDDGKLVVFKRGNELYVVNADGSNFHKLVSSEYLRPYRPRDSDSNWADLYAWMPNTHTIYFTTMAHAAEFGFIYPDFFTWDLFRVEVDSGEIHQLLPKKQGGIPYFSPNGKWIALVQSDVIYIINPEGSIFQNFAFDRTYGGTEGGEYLPKVVWLQDSHSSRVVVPTANFSVDNAETNLWDIPPQGGASIVFSYKNWWSPGNSLAPDGSTIQYTIVSWPDYKPSFNNYIHRQDSDVEISFDGQFISWSPDGSKIVLKNGNNDESAYSLMDITKGSNSTLITGDVMVWIDDNRYLYTGDDANTLFASLGERFMKIDENLSELKHKDYFYSFYILGDRNWTLPFDFSK